MERRPCAPRALARARAALYFSGGDMRSWNSLSPLNLSSSSFFTGLLATRMRRAVPQWKPGLSAPRSAQLCGCAPEEPAPSRCRCRARRSLGRPTAVARARARVIDVVSSSAKDVVVVLSCSSTVTSVACQWCPTFGKPDRRIPSPHAHTLRWGSCWKRDGRCVSVRCRDPVDGSVRRSFPRVRRLSSCRRLFSAVARPFLGLSFLHFRTYRHYAFRGAPDVAGFFLSLFC